MKIEVLCLGADARVNNDVVVSQRGDPEGAPNAWRPPPPLTHLYPRGGGAERERMDHPRRRRTGVTDQAKARFQPLETVPHRCRIGLNHLLQRADIGGEAM